MINQIDAHCSVWCGVKLAWHTEFVVYGEHHVCSHCYALHFNVVAFVVVVGDNEILFSVFTTQLFQRNIGAQSLVTDVFSITEQHVRTQNSQ